MRAVIQRVKNAQVSIGGEVHSAIGQGFLILLGVCQGDTVAECEMLAAKTVAMRVFSDEAGKMNLSLEDISGQVLVVSQFTLHADCRKGNRPSFAASAPPEEANGLYEMYVSLLRDKFGSDRVSTGVFAADMQVSLINDGPVTIILDSDDLKKPRRS